MVIVSGSLAYDAIMDFPGKFSDHIDSSKIHILNVSFLVNDIRRGFGGTAGNIAYNLSLLGIKSAILGMAGKDFAPYKQFLEKNEVDITFIKIIKKFDTSTAFGITDSRDNQIWGFYTGADSLSDQLSTEIIPVKIDIGIIAPQNPRSMLKFAGEYEKQGIKYLFDPGMQLPWFNGQQLIKAFNGASIIIGNDYEIGIMEKKTGIPDLHSHFKDKIIITTLGEEGSKVSYENKDIIIKSSRVKNVSDPAGAGDAYRSGFVAGYLRGLPVLTCAQMGSVAAAYTVEKYGTTTHFFTIAEFIKRYKDNYQENLDLG